mmetsp:Transcript_23291/g.42003  ORF Transcript_23291/g.42003 Transcript_23291/m.42003 type:complete len:177 (-) Transcript_23291:311-841(-)
MPWFCCGGGEDEGGITSSNKFKESKKDAQNRPNAYSVGTTRDRWVEGHTREDGGRKNTNDEVQAYMDESTRSSVNESDYPEPSLSSAPKVAFMEPAASAAKKPRPRPRGVYHQPETTAISAIPSKPKVKFANNEVGIASSMMPFAKVPKPAAPAAESSAFVQEKHQRVDCLPGMVD